MSFYLSAPYGQIQATVMLPSPQLGDALTPSPVIQIKNAMDGTLVSYVKSTNRIKINYDFILTEAKAIELQEYIKVYAKYDMYIVDHNDNTLKMKLINLPVSFNSIGNGEYKAVKLEFEGDDV